MENAGDPTKLPTIEETRKNLLLGKIREIIHTAIVENSQTYAEKNRSRWVVLRVFFW